MPRRINNDEQVGKDDLTSFKNNNEWLKHHPKDSKFFKDLNHILDELKQTYNRDFRNLVYGDFQDSTEIKASLNRIKRAFDNIIWVI